MLEHECLLLRRWEVHQNAPLPAHAQGRLARPIWAILEPNTRALVGLARPLATSKGIWARWFGRGGLAVFENDDEPLVCTLRRGWSLSHTWDLHDADDHMVGRIAGGLIQGPLNRFWIMVNQANAAAEFRDPDGRTLATVTRQTDARLVTFAGELKGDPFARMLMLGAALVLPERLQGY
jgi:hypothetical protein